MRVTAPKTSRPSASAVTLSASLTLAPPASQGTECLMPVRFSKSLKGTWTIAGGGDHQNTPIACCVDAIVARPRTTRPAEQELPRLAASSTITLQGPGTRAKDKAFVSGEIVE